ncbi:MAG: type II secretion system F family protein [Candidatus Aenigmarchaeota archaeon]|nr:type II secretion system F family protein [Candidatus Aenigmarchaeota archaeon]
MYPALIRFFGKTGSRFFGRQLASLKELTEKSNLPIIYETYVGQLFFYCFLSLNLFLVFFLYLFLLFWGLSFTASIASAGILTLTLTSFIATVFYLYPFAKYQRQKEDLERNMVFGIPYLSIVSRSGVPLQKIIYCASKEKEFGEFSKEFGRAHKYISLMGKDAVSSLKEVANRTSSEKFKKFLDGLTATVMSGSDISKYLVEEGKKELEVYRERGKKHTAVMSLLADFYLVALLIAPLCLTIILVVFSLMEPTFLGLEIHHLMTLIVDGALPLLGIIYLALLGLVKL